MMTPLLEFAHRRFSKWESCAGFTIRWLRTIGVKSRLPTTREILEAWRDKGVLEGAEHWFALIGLERCEPGPNCIVVVEQPDGDPLVGATDQAGNFVSRTFGAVVFKREPRIIAAWSMPPGAAHV